MKKFLQKLSYSLVLFAFILVLTSHSTLASSLDFSKGIMPDSPLYQLDLNLEQVNLLSAASDNQKLAQLHLQYGTERLNELNYLAEKNDLALNNIVTVSEDYQKNINKFSKLISQDQTTDSTEKAQKLTPKIDELQAIQTKIVTKINENPAQEEVKIIVKSTIQESQVDLMQAVVKVKKPIEEQVVNNQDISPESTDKPLQQEAVKKLDAAIENLNKQKNQLAAEIVEDEKTLKVKKEISSDQTVINIDNHGELLDKSTDNTSNPITTESNNENTDSLNTDSSDPSINTEETTIVSPDNSNEDQSSQENITTSDNPTGTSWYYSPTCDYISDKPGKDPVCGEEMVLVSSLPKDHAFFSKYIYKDGKYVQNVDDLTKKEENDILKQAETPIVPTPVDTTIENSPVTTPEQPEITEEQVVL